MSRPIYTEVMLFLSQITQDPIGIFLFKKKIMSRITWNSTSPSSCVHEPNMVYSPQRARQPHQTRPYRCHDLWDLNVTNQTNKSTTKLPCKFIFSLSINYVIKDPLSRATSLTIVSEMIEGLYDITDRQWPLSLSL